MARQASPHSAASVCRICGRRERPPKFSKSWLTSASPLRSGVRSQLIRGAALEDDVGFEQHVGLQRHFAVGVHVGPVEHDVTR